MDNEYQGFTGSNYEEDDRERAKHGGFVKFFNADDSQQVSPQQMVLRQIAENPLSVITKNYDKAKEYRNLDNVRDNIMKNQQRLDEILNDAIVKYPGVKSDIENNREDHYQEFVQAYPEYAKLLDQQNQFQKQYQEHPLHFQHLTDRTKDEDKTSGLRESEIFNLLKPNGI